MLIKLHATVLKGCGDGLAAFWLVCNGIREVGVVFNEWVIVGSTVETGTAIELTVDIEAGPYSRKEKREAAE